MTSYDIISHHITSYHTILHYIILCHTIFYSLYMFVLCHAMLYTTYVYCMQIQKRNIFQFERKRMFNILNLWIAFRMSVVIEKAFLSQVAWWFGTGWAQCDPSIACDSEIVLGTICVHYMAFFESRISNIKLYFYSTIQSSSLISPAHLWGRHWNSRT